MSEIAAKLKAIIDGLAPEDLPIPPKLLSQDPVPSPAVAGHGARPGVNGKHKPADHAASSISQTGVGPSVERSRVYNAVVLGGQLLLWTALYLPLAYLSDPHLKTVMAMPGCPIIGFAIGIVLLGGNRLGAAIFATIFLTRFWLGNSLALSIIDGGVHTLEALLICRMLRQFRQVAPSFEKLREFADLFAAAFLIGLPCALLGSGLLVLAGELNSALLWTHSLIEFLGDLMGILIIIPAIFVWTRKRWKLPGWTALAKTLGSFLVLSVSAGLLFFGEIFTVGTQPWLSYLLLPVLLGIALGLGIRSGVTAVLVVNALALTATMVGLGPFRAGTGLDSLWPLFTFQLTSTLMTLVVAVGDAERRRAHETLRLNERRMRQMIENLPVAAVYVDGDAVTVNTAAGALFGIDPVELSERGPWFHPLEQAQMNHPSWSPSDEWDSGQTPRERVEIKRPDGDSRWIEVNCYDSGPAQVWLLKDVTEEHRLRDAWNSFSLPSRTQRTCSC